MLQFWSALNPSGLALAHVLINVLWQSTLLLAAIGILTWALRRRPASLRHALWVGAIVLLPLAVAMPLNGEGMHNPVAEPVPAATAFVAQRDVPASNGSRESKEEQLMAATEGIKLDFSGDAFMKDSFSLVMQAAARHYGKRADYETIYMLSTNAFAPDVCPVEPCRATWRLLGRGACLDLVARRFGLAVREVQLPEEHPRPAADERGRTWGTPAYNRWLAERMRDCSAAVRKELVPGAMVITDGGWRREWHQWGIVTEAQPDGRIAGITPDRPEPNSMDHDEHYWVLTAGERGMTPEDADLEMLRRAIHRIRGDQEPFLPKRKMVYGLQAMDLWIAQMEKPVFQEDDAGSSARNARLNALYAYEGATAVVSYLRGRLPTFPKPAQAHIERAVPRYELIAGLLQPYSVWEQGSGYRSGEGTATPLIGTPSRQRDHAESVLKPVRAALAAAAEELEKALAAVAQEAGG
jgi:hypothetical protein